MPSYWLIKLILILVLAALTAFIMRPARTAKRLAMRRLWMLILIVFAMFAVLFPGLLNQLAELIGVERGINLLVYSMAVAVFMQMAAAYHRDREAEQRLTRLARAVALSNARHPREDQP
ncbi:MAG: DUF2304 domain-containing protein [Actinomycetaceae bacterium]|nr:DUF2304 domain-containing protein [Actinomycetaceae bacterium]